jgi:cell division protein FtsL
MSKQGLQLKNRIDSHRRQQNTLPARYVFAGVIAVALVVLFPLLTVWKQAYITGASITQKELSDSVAVLSRKAAALRMTAQELSSNERIEQIAGQWLSLGHPASDRIVIVYPEEKTGAGVFAGMIDGWKFFAVIRRSLMQGQG